MFLLKELPNKEQLKAFARNFPEMEIANVAACLRLLKAASLIMNDLEAHFSKNDLSQARFFILIVLKREKSASLSCTELTRAIGASKPNMTRLIANLEEDELIKRTSDKDDIRVSNISITKKGERVLQKVLPGYYRIINEAMHKLSEIEKKKLARILDKLI